MSWDGTLSSGGTPKHGTPSHVNQGNPGLYADPFAVVFDAAGAESRAVQAWVSDLTFPANTYILGSNSKRYKAVISNIGFDPTVDGGTHWIQVADTKPGTVAGQVGIWNATSGLYEPGVVGGGGGGMPTGTDAQFPINDGVTPWIAVNASGDVSLVDTGAFTVNKIKTVPVGLTSWAVNAGRIPVFNGASLESVAMSNDATLAATGALTLKNSGVVAAAYDFGHSATYDAQGRATAAVTTTGTKDANHFLNGAGAFTTITVSALPSLAGDVSGAINANTVDKVKNVPIGTWTTTAGRLPVFDGTNLVSVPLSNHGTLAASGALTLNNVGTPGAVGDSTHTVTVTTDATGRVSALTANDISASLLPVGTDTQTIRNSGGSWIANSFALNSGTQFGIGSTLPTAGVLFGVSGVGSTTPLARITNTDATKPTIFQVYNSGQSKGLDLAHVGATNDFWAGTAQGDALIRAAAGTVLWLGGTTTPIAKLDTATLGANKFFACPDGSSGAMVTRAMVAADVPNLDGSKIIGATPGRIAYDNGTNLVWSAAGSTGQTLRMNGTIPLFNSILTNDGTGVTITPTATNVGLTVTGTTGATTIPALAVTNDKSTLANFTNSEAHSATAGSQLGLYTGSTPSTTGDRLGILSFGKNIAGTTTTFGSIEVLTEEDGTTNIGARMRLRVGQLATTSMFLPFEIRGNGDVVGRAVGTEVGTTGTGGMFWLPTSNGVPTGVPANSYTGAAPVRLDRSNNRLYAYMGSAWQNLSPGSNAATAIQNKAANYTMVMGDFYVTGDTSGGNFTVKLPDAATNTNPANTVYWFKNIASSNTLTITTLTAGDKVNGVAGGNFALGGVAGQQGGQAAVILNGTDYQRVKI